MEEKTFKRVCQCEKCGNEAEMTITCTLDAEPERLPPEPDRYKDTDPHPAGRRKGHAVCSQCGNEADIWLEM